jgi:hypothetical protein
MDHVFWILININIYLFNTFLKQYKIQSVPITVIKKKRDKYVDPYRIHNSIV